MSGSHTPSAGVPFSALTPSIWPQEILATCAQVGQFTRQAHQPCCQAVALKGTHRRRFPGVVARSTIFTQGQGPPPKMLESEVVVAGVGRFSCNRVWPWGRVWAAVVTPKPCEARCRLPWRMSACTWFLRHSRPPGLPTDADPSSSRLPGSSLVEEPQQTLKWQAHLEFTHNHDVGDLTWDKIAISLPRSEKLRSLVLAGIPHSMRPQLWMRLSGALQKKHNSELSYRETVKNSSNDETIAAKQVRPRLFSDQFGGAASSGGWPAGFLGAHSWVSWPLHGRGGGESTSGYVFRGDVSIEGWSGTLFSGLVPRSTSTGAEVQPGLLWASREQRMAACLPREAVLFPVVSGVELSNLNEDMVRGPVLPIPGKVAACLLLFLEEEDAFWMMCAIVEDLLPASYFSTTLLGVQTDQRVLRHLIVQYLPRLDKLLQEHDIELSLITLHWFLTAFASVVPLKLLLRIWDLFFYEGSLVLFQTALGMLHLKEEELIQSENSASIFNTLSDIPSQIEDAELLLGVAMRLAGSLTDVAVETQRRKHLAYLIADQGQLLATSTTTHLSQVVRRRAQRRKSGITSLLFGEDDLEALKAKNIKQTELVADLREAILRVARHFQCTDPKNCSVELAPDYSTESHQRDHENYVACSRSHRRRAKALLDFERHDDDELGFRKNDIITIISQKDEHCWVGELNGLRGWFPAKFVEVLDERSKEVRGHADPGGCTCLDPPSRDMCREDGGGIVGGHACSVGHTCPPLMCSPSPQAAGREVERDFDSVYSRLVLCKTYRLDEDGKVLTPEELLYRAVQSVNVTHDAAHAQMDVKLRSLICVGLKGHPCVQEEKKPLKEGVQDMLVKHHLFSWDIDG
nr:small G protein signaling modulator 3 [Loxodonta africana]